LTEVQPPNKFAGKKRSFKKLYTTKRGGWGGVKSYDAEKGTAYTTVHRKTGLRVAGQHAKKSF